MVGIIKYALPAMATSENSMVFLEVVGTVQVVAVASFPTMTL